MNIPSGFNYIQTRATQVWNFYEIVFDPNVRCNKVTFTYKLFQGEQMLKVKTGERVPFWCMLLVFTRSDGKWFMPPIIVHQSKEYSKELNFDIPPDLKFHDTPCLYMDRYQRLKSMDQLFPRMRRHPVNNQSILFDGYESHFDDHALIHI